MSGTAASVSTAGPIVEITQLCDVQADGTTVGFLRAITYNPGGGVTTTDTGLDGVTPYVVAGTVAVCEPDPAALTVQAHHQLLGAAVVWNPPAGLVSVTFTVLTGSATVLDSDGTTAAGLPAGLSASWGVEHDAETLTGPQSITADAGSTVYVHWTRR